MQRKQLVQLFKEAGFQEKGQSLLPKHLERFCSNQIKPLPSEQSKHIIHEQNTLSHFLEKKKKADRGKFYQAKRPTTFPGNYLDLV